MMNISEFCIKRPVFATVLSLILIVVGLVGLHYLDTRFLPKFQQNHLMIETTYPGASAKLIETSITTPLEAAVSGVEGLDTVSSMSYQGYSEITLQLKSDVDKEAVANKVRDKLENARSKLPSNIDPPQVHTGGNGNGELMDVGFTDPNMSVAAIRDYLQRYVLDGVEQTEGIAKVNIVGANAYTMEVRLDPKKMAARHVTESEVQVAIQNSNVELPAGKVRGLSFDYPITASTKLNTTQQFNDIVVKQTGDSTIKIRDIGFARIGTNTTSDSYIRMNGSPGDMLNIHATDDANPIDSAKAVRHFISGIKDQLPRGMHVVYLYDQSIYMQNSIHEVYVSIFFAILCVLLVIYLFLGNIRSVLIPVVTIPICLFASFGLMYFLGFSINIITLLAMVLSIGLVVDDAIVMLENIHRHIEKGEKPMTAAIKGSKEMTFAVIAMTLTLAAVYAPVGLIHGKISAIFKPFAFSLAGAVIISGFVALTLTPMMCARLLKSNTGSSGFSAVLDRFFNRLAQGYHNTLALVLKKRYIVLVLVGFISVGGYYLASSMQKTFMPQEDMGLVVGFVNTPSGANIHYLANQTKGVAKLLERQPGVASVLSYADTSDQGFNFSMATLKPFAKRDVSAQAVANATNAQIANVPGLDASVFPPSFGGSMSSQLEFSITGNMTYKQLYQVSKQLVTQLNQLPQFKNVKSSLTFNSQQYEIHIKRHLAAQLNVGVNSIDNVIATMMGGLKVSTIDVSGQSYDVYMLGLKKYQHHLSSLNEFSVSNRAGKLIPLSNLISVKPILAQTQLAHYNRQRAATIDLQLGKGYTLGTDVQYLQQHLPNLLSAGVHYAFQGSAKDVSSSNSSMGLVFVLALVFIYLVLAAQFESFVDPLVILFAVPFSVFGAMVVLKLMHGSINIYTIVGLVTLIGLIAKHGILITQFANEQKRAGVAATKALLNAARTRLRPILMTTAAMIFGALPLILASGASATSRQQIGAVVISGLFFGTFFSLVLVPVLYSGADSIRAFWSHRRQKKQNRSK